MDDTIFLPHLPMVLLIPEAEIRKAAFSGWGKSQESGVRSQGVGGHLDPLSHGHVWDIGVGDVDGHGCQEVPQHHLDREGLRIVCPGVVDTR